MFYHAFLYLVTRIPRKDFAHPFVDDVLERTQEEIKITLGSIIDSVKAGNTKVTLPGIDANGKG